MLGLLASAAGTRASARCLGLRGAGGLLRQADGHVDVGSAVLLQVLASLLFIVLPGDPDGIVIQVGQGPVTGTVPGVQHRVRGKLHLDTKSTFARRPSPIRTPGAPSDSPTFHPPKYTHRRTPNTPKTVHDYPCVLQTKLN